MTKVLVNFEHLCQAMQLRFASRLEAPHSGSGSMEEPVVVVASGYHRNRSMMGTHILDGYMVLDLIHPSGRGVHVTICFRHSRLMATVNVDYETVAA